MNVRVLPICAAVMLSTTAVQGQACLGLASLEVRPMNFTVGAVFSDGAKGGDARFGFGTAKAFGGVSASVVKTDGVSGTSKGATVDGGLSFPMGEKKAGMLCPVASVDYQKSPDIDDGDGGTYNASAMGAAAGVAIGGVVNSSSSVSFIPFASVRAAYTRLKVSAGSFSDTSNETYGILSGGVGIVFSPTVLLRPFVQVPFGLDGADASYGVGVSFGFGKR